MIEFTFVEPKTAEEAYVRLDEVTGKVVDVYVDRDAGIFASDHEDADRLSGFTWERGVKGGLFRHCGQPEEFVRYLEEEWELGEDRGDWDRLRSPDLD